MLSVVCGDGYGNAQISTSSFAAGIEICLTHSILVFGRTEHQRGDPMRVELQSKLIDAVVYDESSQQLRLFLVNGHIRDYSEVPRSVLFDLQTTKSPGTYYMKLIRKCYPGADQLH